MSTTRVRLLIECSLAPVLAREMHVGEQLFGRVLEEVSGLGELTSRLSLLGRFTSSSFWTETPSECRARKGEPRTRERV